MYTRTQQRKRSPLPFPLISPQPGVVLVTRNSGSLLYNNYIIIHPLEGNDDVDGDDKVAVFLG